MAKRRIDEVVGEAWDDFFSEPNTRRTLIPLSDGYFRFSEEDLQNLYDELNSHPNLFGVYFDVSVVPNLDDLSPGPDYIQIKRQFTQEMRYAS